MLLGVSDDDVNACEMLMQNVVQQTGGDLLSNIVLEHLATGGKRLRARLALGAIKAMGGDPKQGYPWAAACELFHNGTLVHDDLQDGDDTRRGHPTVWVRHGAAQAINAGDLLILLPNLLIERLEQSTEVRSALQRLLCRNTCEVIRGQAEEIAMTEQGLVDQDMYLQTISRKTSALFGLPVEGAAIVCEKSQDVSTALGNLFRRVGVVFQMQDDVLDLYGDKGRKAKGADIREGKISALIVAHVANYPKEKEDLLAILKKPRVEVTDEEVLMVIDRLRESGACASVCKQIQTESDAICSSKVLELHPDLQRLTHDLLEKIVTPIRHVM